MSELSSVEEKTPGLLFHVVVSALKKNTGGVELGTISMQCEVTDRQLWNMAVEKFDNYKVFSSTTEEMLAALSYELNSADSQLQMVLEREQELREELQNKVDEIADLRQILHDIGVNIGVE